MRPYTQPAPYTSQWGEDRWLVDHLLVPAVGVFVDIGAGDGHHGSNTAYLESVGWGGLCVDADPRNHTRLRRRTCHVRTCPVSTRPGPQPFSLYAAKPSWSGLGHRGPGYTTTTMACRTLTDLLDETGIGRIDLLSLDVEGTELDVWASFDPERHRPAIVIIEYDDHDPRRSEAHIRATLGTDRYHVLHRTPSNLILRRTDPGSLRRWPDAP